MDRNHTIDIHVDKVLKETFFMDKVAMETDYHMDTALWIQLPTYHEDND